MKRRDGAKGLGFGLIALLPITCCLGLPLIVAAGLSVTVVALVGGIAFGAIVLAATVLLFSIRIRTRRRRASFPVPSERQTP